MVRFLNLTKLNKNHLLETFLKRRHFSAVESHVKQFSVANDNPALPCPILASKEKRNEWNYSNQYRYFKNTAALFVLVSIFSVKNALCESKRNDKTEREICNYFPIFSLFK